MGNCAKKKTLTIGKNKTIGHFAHIIGVLSVAFQNIVLFAVKVFISDCTHRYEDVSVPVIEQGIEELTPVSIGEGSWIGENVCICGASIGKHCVIGANSVVITNIPDYSVAVGSPARVIKTIENDLDE